MVSKSNKRAAIGVAVVVIGSLAIGAPMLVYYARKKEDESDEQVMDESDEQVMDRTNNNEEWESDPPEGDFPVLQANQDFSVIEEDVDYAGEDKLEISDEERGAITRAEVEALLHPTFYLLSDEHELARSTTILISGIKPKLGRFQEQSYARIMSVPYAMSNNKSIDMVRTNNMGYRIEIPVVSQGAFRSMEALRANLSADENATSDDIHVSLWDARKFLLAVTHNVSIMLGYLYVSWAAARVSTRLPSQHIDADVLYKSGIDILGKHLQEMASIDGKKWPPYDMQKRIHGYRDFIAWLKSQENIHGKKVDEITYLTVAGVYNARGDMEIVDVSNSISKIVTESIDFVYGGLLLLNVDYNYYANMFTDT